MNYSSFSFTASGYIITRTTSIYSRDASGNWNTKPDTVTREEITPKQYTNYITSVPFFNNWPGASCRVNRGYTDAGLLPVRVITVSPGQEKRIDARFQIECRPGL